MSSPPSHTLAGHTIKHQHQHEPVNQRTSISRTRATLGPISCSACEASLARSSSILRWASFCNVWRCVCVFGGLCVKRPLSRSKPRPAFPYTHALRALAWMERLIAPVFSLISASLAFTLSFRPFDCFRTSRIVPAAHGCVRVYVSAHVRGCAERMGCLPTDASMHAKQSMHHYSLRCGPTHAWRPQSAP